MYGHLSPLKGTATLAGPPGHLDADPAIVFGAPLDRMTVWSSAAVLVLLASGEAAVIWAWAAGHGAPAWATALLGLVAVGLPGLVGVLWWLAPRGYRVDPRGVTVVRLGPDVRVAASDIAGAEPVALTQVIKVCGASGLFGAWGWFHARPLGLCRLYVRRRSGLVAIRRRQGLPVVVAPDDPDAFIEAIHAII
jgi:hypothetical protein